MIFKNIKTFVVAAFAAATLFSCSSDENFNNSKLYVNSTLHPNSVLPKETIFIIGKDVNNNRFEIPLKITTPISKDLKGTFSIDKDAIELFNAKHETEYAIPNSEAINWIQQSVTISSGKYISSEPAVLEITNFDLLDNSLTYCLPVRITDTDKSLSISNNLNTIFIVFNIVKQDIYPVSVPFEGTPIDTSIWKLTNPENPSDEEIYNLINGSFWGWNCKCLDYTVEIDLTKNEQVKGIILEPAAFERAPTNYMILSSDNGEVWKEHGYITPNFKSNDPYFITFNNEISTQLIRIKMSAPIKLMSLKAIGIWSENK